MRYFRVYWCDASGPNYSDPLERWTDAEEYRRTIGPHAEILKY